MSAIARMLWRGVTGWIHQGAGWVRGFVYGAARTWVEAPFHLRRRKELERMWVLLMLTEAAGIPLAPPDLPLRLLPYMVPQILFWRRPYLWDEELEVTHLPHMGH